MSIPRQVTIGGTRGYIGMGGHFEESGGCKGFAMEAVKETKAKRISVREKAVRTNELTAENLFCLAELRGAK